METSHVVGGTHCTAAETGSFRLALAVPPRPVVVVDEEYV